MVMPSFLNSSSNIPRRWAVAIALPDEIGRAPTPTPGLLKRMTFGLSSAAPDAAKSRDDSRANVPATFALDDPDIVAITKVSIPGAGNGGGVLDTTFASVTSATVGVLQAKTKTDVTNATVTITYTKATPGSINVPLDSNHKPIDHIQFRWIYFTTSWTGTGTATCDWTDGRCVGAVGLWQ